MCRNFRDSTFSEKGGQRRHQKDIQRDIKTFTLFYRQEYRNAYLDLFDATGSTNLYAMSNQNADASVSVHGVGTLRIYVFTSESGTCEDSNDFHVLWEFTI